MASSVLNSGLEQIRGRISDWVYKIVNGKRVIARRPVTDPNRVPTASEIAARRRFSDAAAFGRSMMADPAVRPVYEQVASLNRKPVFAVMIGDFFTPPVIHAINLDTYTGQIGGRIAVRASDDVQVTSVSVAIRDRITNTVLESGPAVFSGADWVYTAATALAPGQSVTIAATAADRPGNQTIQERVYP